MAYGGLRGAVGFSLVMMIDKSIVPSAGIFVTTTLAVVISTVFIQVGILGPIVFIQVGILGPICLHPGWDSGALCLHQASSFRIHFLHPRGDSGAKIFI
jgi:hypothetical protein